MTGEGTCRSCSLWRRSVRPAKDESAEYIEWRPCALHHRPVFLGLSTLSVRDVILTSPSASCQGHRLVQEQGTG